MQCNAMQHFSDCGGAVKRKRKEMKRMLKHFSKRNVLRNERSVGGAAKALGMEEAQLHVMVSSKMKEGSNVYIFFHLIG
jgi:hypothetical protein